MSAARGWLRSRETLWVVAILALALGVRLVVHAYAPVFLSKDSQTYYLPAWDLAVEHELDIGIRRTPVYPLFLAAGIATFGEDPRWLALLQHLVGLVTVGATYLLGRLTFGRLAGALAALATALNGPLLIYERYLMTETLFTALLAVALVIAVLALKQPTPGRLAWAGATLALAILTRPIAEALLPLLPLTLLLMSRNARLEPRRLALLGGAYLAGLAIVMLPWMARNALAHGSFSAEGALGQALVGRTIKNDDYRAYYGCAPGDGLKERVVRIVCEEGASDDPGGGIVTQRVQKELGLSQSQTSSLLLQVAAEGILRNPIHYTRTTTELLADLFASREKRELLSDHVRLRRMEGVMRTFAPGSMRKLFGPIPPIPPHQLALAETASSLYRPSVFFPVLLVGLVLGLTLAAWQPRYRLGLYLAVTLLVLMAMTTALNGSLARYRYPLDPIFAVLAAGGLAGAAQLALARLRLGRAAQPAASTARPRLGEG